MRKFSLIAAFCCIFSLCSSVMAWWSTGHELIGKIAENNLTSVSKTVSEKYLKNVITYPGNLNFSKNTSTFAEANTWCDAIKGADWKNERNAEVNSMLHYINPKTYPDQKISYSSTGKNIKTLLASNSDLGKYNCYTALLSSIKSLTDQKTSEAEKAVAFRFLLHTVGDMHMPLHASAPIINGINTRGGNEIVFAKPFTAAVIPPPEAELTTMGNLHALWDAGAGFCSQLPYNPENPPQTKAQNDYIAKEAQVITDSESKIKAIKKSINNSDILVWAVESNMIAAKYISNKEINYTKDPKEPEKQVIGSFKDAKQYIASVQNVSKNQIYLGGMRMANLLNAIFDPANANKKYVDTVQKIKQDKNIPTLEKLFPNPLTFELAKAKE
jgi:hypothetical protein